MATTTEETAATAASPAPEESSLQPISIARAEKLWNEVFTGIVEEKGLGAEEAKFILGAASGMWKTKVSKACLATGIAVPEDPGAKVAETRAQGEEERIAELSRELGALGKQVEQYRQRVPAALRERLGQCRDSNIENLERRVNEFEGRVPESPNGAGAAIPVQTTELLNDTERRMRAAAKRFREAQLELDLLSKRADRLTSVATSLGPKRSIKRVNNNTDDDSIPIKKMKK